MTLHEAVHQTANKLLDTPKYVRLMEFPPVTWTPLLHRFYDVLSELGYARVENDDVKGMAVHVHPLAHKYFKKYGEQYVQNLEAVRRLTH